jgi:hypothetical protein
MKHLVTILSLLILTLACSKQIVPKQPDSSVLTCEPLGLIDLPKGTCVGTQAAQAAMTSQGCTCQNQEYVAIPSDDGHACVHLHSVLSLLESVHTFLDHMNLPDVEQGINHKQMSKEVIRITIKLTLLKRDAEILHLALLRGDSHKNIDTYVRRVQHGIKTLGTEHHATDCAPSPPPTSRELVLSKYIPLE